MHLVLTNTKGAHDHRDGHVGHGCGQGHGHGAKHGRETHIVAIARPKPREHRVNRGRLQSQPRPSCRGAEDLPFAARQFSPANAG